MKQQTPISKEYSRIPVVNRKFDGEAKIGEEELALTRLGAREAHKLQEGDRNANMTGLLRANFSARDLGDSYSNFA
jgi:hypothetical protein